MKQNAKFTELGLNLISRKLFYELLNLKILHSLIFFKGGGAWSGGAWSKEESGPGGCLLETPRDGYCCGRYASYWNAFLLKILHSS